MANVARILVGDDLEREKKHEPNAVTRLAADLASALGSEIHIVHTYRTPELTVPIEALAFIEGPYVEAMARSLESEAETIRAQRPSLRVVPAVEKGSAVEVLLNDISTHNCQLVVLGTHARHGVKRAFLGSVAEEVIRRSPVPVLTVNPHTKIRPGYRPSKILVPLDLSSTQNGTIQTAVDFARNFKAPLEFLHVIEEWLYPVVQSASLLAGGFVMPLERDLKELGNLRYTQLQGIIQPIQAQGLPATLKLIERASSISGAVLEEAKAIGADLIIMGHRKNASKLEYAFLGSVSRAIVREAHCPVLTTSN